MFLFEFSPSKVDHRTLRKKGCTVRDYDFGVHFSFKHIRRGGGGGGRGLFRLNRQWKCMSVILPVLLSPYSVFWLITPGHSFLAVYESASQELWVFLMYANSEVQQSKSLSYFFFILLIMVLSWLVEVYQLLSWIFLQFLLKFAQCHDHATTPMQLNLNFHLLHEFWLHCGAKSISIIDQLLDFSMSPDAFFIQVSLCHAQPFLLVFAIWLLWPERFHRYPDRDFRWHAGTSVRQSRFWPSWSHAGEHRLAYFFVLLLVFNLLKSCQVTFSSLPLPLPSPFSLWAEKKTA